MQRCQHSCGCEGNAVGRDPETRILLCAGCMGRSILGTDCSRARKYFGHVPVRFVGPSWSDPPPLRNGDRSALPEAFDAAFLRIRTAEPAPIWDFMPLAAIVAAVTNPTKPPKDPPSGPLPPPPGRPTQPNPPRR